MGILLNWVSGLTTLFLFWFPNVNSNTIDQINSQTTALRTFLTNASWLVPVNTLLAVISIILATEAIVLGAKIAGWVLHNVTLGFFKRM